MNNRKWLDLFSRDLKIKYNSEQTRKIYYSGVKKFLEYFHNEREPKEIPNGKIKDWLLQAQTINTRKHRLCSIRSFYSMTVKMPKKIVSIPYPKKIKSIPLIIDKNFLINKIESITNKKHRAIIQLSFSTAMRVSEVINLKIDDVDSKRMIIHIRNAKGAKDRIVKLTESTLNVLRDYFKQERPKVYLFNGQSSQKYSATSCNKIVKKYLGDRYHFHSLRHAGLTSMIDCGTDVSIVQKIAGHNSIKTTMGYLHISKQMIDHVHAPI